MFHFKGFSLQESVSSCYSLSLKTAKCPDGRDVELGIKKHRNGNVTEVQIKSKMNLTIVGSISESKLVALKERYARSFSGEFVTSVDNYKGKLET